LAFNPSLISTYSIANSQVLIIFILVWVLVLTLGPNRLVWQIILGSILAAVLVLTRENLVFVPPLLILYILWEHGRQKGFLALASFSVVLVIGHLVYWPDIMQLWLRWLPFKSFLGLQESVSTGAMLVHSHASLATRIDSLALAMRMNFIPFIGSILVLLMWPRKTAWPSRSHFRAAVFLAVSFFVLLISHAWVSLGNEFCIYCLTNYFAFWGNLGLLLVVVTLGALNRSPSWLAKLAIVVGLIMLSSAIFYSWSEQVGDWLLNLPMPRVQNDWFAPGITTLWHLIDNKYHVVYSDARQYTPAVFGLLGGLVLVFVLFLVFKKYLRKKNFSLAYFMAMIALGLGFLLSPLMSWPVSDPLCNEDVVASFQQLGPEVAKIIPPGGKVYLDGTITAIPLLYANNYTLFPPQVNGSYARKSNGDANSLLEHGLWNDKLALTWRGEANVFIISDNRIYPWNTFFSPDEFTAYQFPSQGFSCTIPDYIDVYYKKP
jgi:hypothetical protein